MPSSRRLAGYHQFHAVNIAVEETIRAAGAGAMELKEGAAAIRQETARRRNRRPARRRGLAHAGIGQEPDDGVLRRAAGARTRRWRTRRSWSSPTATTSTTSSSARSPRCHELLRQTPVQAENRDHLRELLAVASGGVVFTTIQKFFPEDKGDKHPLLSDRRNIVVIADEAHRSQYDFIDGFARHMRDALPNASFIGFTGTPIEKTDANTRAVFGDYISIYDIQRAVEDKATVPIYYESRLAKLELKPSEKPKIDPEFEEVTEGEELEHKEKLKTKWAALEAVVGAEKRIELIADDLVEHFEKRGLRRWTARR